MLTLKVTPRPSANKNGSFQVTYGDAVSRAQSDGSAISLTHIGDAQSPQTRDATCNHRR